MNRLYIGGFWGFRYTEFVPSRFSSILDQILRIHWWFFAAGAAVPQRFLGRV